MNSPSPRNSWKQIPTLSKSQIVAPWKNNVWNSWEDAAEKSSNSLNEKKAREIQDLRKTVAKLRSQIARLNQPYHLIASVSFVIGWIISGIGIGIHGQLSPKSSIQSIFSSWAKIYSDGKTTLDRLYDAERNTLVVAQQTEKLADNTILITRLREIIALQAELINIYKWTESDLRTQLDEKSNKHVCSKNWTIPG